jgi:hypothetical protein
MMRIAGRAYRAASWNEVTKDSRRGLLGLLVFLSLFVSGCGLLNSDRSRTTETIVLDTAEARLLISEEAERDRAQEQSLARLSPADRTRQIGDMMAHPEKYTQARATFLAAMRRLPSAALDPGTYYEEIEDSQAKCSNDPISTTAYFKVRVFSGPSNGAEGWRCGPAEPINELP